MSISVVRDTAKYLGMAAANLVVIADPAVLVLGGIMASAADLLLEPVRLELARRVPPGMMQTLTIVPAALGADAAAIGAARLGDGRAPMIVLSGAELVLPDRILTPGTLVIEDGRIADIRPGGAQGRMPSGHSPSLFAFHGHYIVPGFIDVHVHGVDGVDSLDGDAAVRAIAARLPRYGVTAFCPTTVACAPEALRRVLDQVRSARAKRRRPALGARAARASREQLHQPRIPRRPADGMPAQSARGAGGGRGRTGAERQEGAERRAEFARAGHPARDRARGAGRRHRDARAGARRRARSRALGVGSRPSRVARPFGATYDEALAAIAAGARHATHLFNRMPPLGHRAPGLAGAVLQTDEVAAELICDGFHVHPAIVRMAIAAKRPSRVIAITDGTAASGLPVGRRARLGGQPITVGESAAFLDDGTLAGSVLTMDRAFQTLVGRIGLSPVDAATLCATTPARELGLVGHGVLAPEAVADLVVLDAQFSVVQTYIAGQLVYSRT